MARRWPNAIIVLQRVAAGNFRVARASVARVREGMARLQVIDVKEDTRVPFLRGILTRSLQNAGLSFDESYELANTIRNELGHRAEVTNEELRDLVGSHLEPFGPQILDRYRGPQIRAEPVVIRSADGEVAPYSRGRHRLGLLSSGLWPEQAASIVSIVFRQLVKRGELEIEADRLQEITRATIERELGAEEARLYDVWQRHQESDRPLLVFIAGTVGSGKSTIATELAHRLGIVRTQSTDMLREVMRSLIPERVLPVLYQSTYNAWQALPATEELDSPSEALLAEGYLTQAEAVSAACEAVVQRASRERLSLIVEGVHVHPSWLTRIADESDATVAPLMLAVLSKKQLRKRIRGRGRQAPGRRAERYLENFDSIWQLQSFLLAEADQAGIPIIFNEEKESTVHQAMGSILKVISDRDREEEEEDARAAS